MQEETFPSVYETQLLGNLWRCFWWLAHNTACLCRMTSDIKHPSRAFRATAELSAEGIGPITPGEEGTRRLCCGDSGMCECQRLVLLTGNVAKVKWPLNCGTLHTATAARWHIASGPLPQLRWGKKQEFTCEKVHNVSVKGPFTRKNMHLK